MEIIYVVEYILLLHSYAHILVTCYTSHFTFRAFYRRRGKLPRNISENINMFIE